MHPSSDDASHRRGSFAPTIPLNLTLIDPKSHSRSSHVTYGSSALEELVGSSDSRVEAIDESSLLLMRVRYCKSCKAHIKGFDHHYPAFGNCIGQNNYFLFMVLLVGFISAEVFYIACSFHVARKFQIFNRNRFEISFAKNLAVSTMLFSLLQVLWQVVFLIWHIYCICFNIRTDEWINWKKYPEFYIVDQSSQGDSIGFPQLMVL